MTISALIARAPKSDIHLHLDGSVRPSTIIELAQEQGLSLPVNDPEELRKRLMPGEHCESLEEYLEAFDITCSVLGTPDALYRVAHELVEDCAGDQHRYMEVRWSTRVLPGSVEPQKLVEAVWAGLRDAGEKHKVVARQILCGMRHEAPKHSIAQARLAVESKHLGVVAYDIAGAEAPFPPSVHEESFQIAREGLLRTTCHAGEAAGADFVKEAIIGVGSERIGHGTRLTQDSALLRYVIDRQIPIEICLTSNVQTKATASFQAHPLRQYLDEGANVVICTDNRTVSDTTVEAELLRAVKYQGLTVDELRRVTAAAFDAAFLPFEERVQLREDALRDFDAIRAEFQL